jgi:uncharacterized Rmd1/YagE family protein
MATTMGETSPLLPTHASPSDSPSRPGLRTSRTVTFSPLTSVSTQSGATSTGALRPSQSPSSALTTPNQPTREQQPMLSAFNSKLRRRNSHGSPLPTTQAFTSGPRAGAQRTTKTTEKLKILPNPDFDDEPDEESGRDVYAQFTRIKDPTARRDAARLGKADRDSLPRVTAYCMAQGYRLEGVMKFMKSRARTRGANPKLFDECLYSPYNYEHLKKNKNSERGSSPVQERLARVMASPRINPGERRFSDSAVEVEDNNKHRRENLIDLQDELEPAEGNHERPTDNLTDLSAVASHSSTDLRHPESDEMHQRSNSELSTTVHTPEIFIFDYGTVVIWGMTVQQEQRFLNDMSKFSDAPLPTESVQTENFNFYYTKEYQARIYNDFISLRDPRNHMTKLAISHALAQSVKTSLFEDLVSETIETTSPLPALIAQTGSVNLTRRQLNMQIGELFILRINIHLQGSVLDSPELMWAEPHLEPVYAAVRSYLEIEQRVGLLTERLDVIAGKP